MGDDIGKNKIVFFIFLFLFVSNISIVSSQEWVNLDYDSRRPFNVSQSVYKLPFLLSGSSCGYFDSSGQLLEYIIPMNVEVGGETRPYSIYFSNSTSREATDPQLFYVIQENSLLFGNKRNRVCKNLTTPIDWPKTLHLLIRFSDIGIPKNYYYLKFYDLTCDNKGYTLLHHLDGDNAWVPIASSEFNVNYYELEAPIKFIGSSVIVGDEIILLPIGEMNNSYVSGETFINYIALDDRIDGYLNHINFSSKENGITFCPLSMNLGNWPKFYASECFEKKSGNNYTIFRYGYAIENKTLTSSYIPYPGKKYFDKSLILVGEKENSNRILILTKPQNIISSRCTETTPQDIVELPPNDDYFFRMDINEDVIVSVCTNRTTDNLFVFEGPRFFFFPEFKHSLEDSHFLSLYLSQPFETEFGVEEYVSDFFPAMGFMDHLFSISATIIPEIKLTSEKLNPFVNWTFRWNDGNVRTRTFYEESNMIEFKGEYVLLEGKHFKDFFYENRLYPFDMYSALITVEYVPPPYLQNKSRPFSIENAPQYNGNVSFEVNQIEMKIYPNIWYFVALVIFYTFLFVFIYQNKKYEPSSKENIAIRLGIIFDSVGIFYFQLIPVPRIFSLASIPFIFAIIYFFDIHKILWSKLSNFIKEYKTNMPKF